MIPIRSNRGRKGGGGERGFTMTLKISGEIRPIAARGALCPLTMNQLSPPRRRNRRRHLSTSLLLLLLCLLAHPAPASCGDPVGGFVSGVDGDGWEAVDELSDAAATATGAPYGASVGHLPSSGDVLVGAPLASLARGGVRMLRRRPLLEEAGRLRSVGGQQAFDGFGEALAVLGSGAESGVGEEILVGAPSSGGQGVGYVDVFRRRAAYGPAMEGLPAAPDPYDAASAHETHVEGWVWHQRLRPDDDGRGLHAAFGRGVAVCASGTQGGATAVVSSAVPTVVDPTLRALVANAPGTRAFGAAAAEPTEAAVRASVRVYRRRAVAALAVRAGGGAGGGNATAYAEAGVLAPHDAPARRDFGRSVACDAAGRGREFVAVGAPVVQKALYGSGRDGRLVVGSGEVATLDGSATFDFLSVLVRRGGTLTASRRAAAVGPGADGGWLRIRVQETFEVEAGGVVNVSALGLGGGPTAFASLGLSQTAHQGDSAAGPGRPQVAGQNGGGGGAGTSAMVGSRRCVYDGSAPRFPTGYTPPNNTLPGEANGGGGGFGTAGEAGTAVECGVSGVGGAAHGSHAVLQPGSGGGSGHPYAFGSGGSGGSGGGVVHIRARILANAGAILCDGGGGGDGGYYSGAGGGGSGGSIRLEGEVLRNNGTVSAVGGAGGSRSAGSGSDGNPDGVRGGGGGVGRVQLAFAVLDGADGWGAVSPPPVDAAPESYDGGVHVFEAVYNDTTTAATATEAAGDPMWVEHAIPRDPGAFHLGHSVAVDGGYLAYGSSQLLTDPLHASNESVFVSRFDEAAGEFLPVQNIPAPWLEGGDDSRPVSARFASHVALSNGTLLVSSVGDALHAGAVWVYRLAGGRFELSEWVVARTPRAGDGFGAAVDLATAGDGAGGRAPAHDTLYVLSETAGLLHVFARQAGNATVAFAKVLCGEYVGYNEAAGGAGAVAHGHQYRVTVNTTLACRLFAYDAAGRPRGGLRDVRHLAVAVNASVEQASPPLEYLAEGVFGFVVEPSAEGVVGVSVLLAGRQPSDPRYRPVVVVATAPVEPGAVRLACNATAEAGETVGCVLDAAGGAGERDAAVNFAVTVVNTDEHRHVFGAGGPAALVRLPAPFGAVAAAVFGDPNDAGGEAGRWRRRAGAYRYGGEVALLEGGVRWEDPGRFSFAFETMLEGVHSVFVTYRVCRVAWRLSSRSSSRTHSYYKL